MPLKNAGFTCLIVFRRSLMSRGLGTIDSGLGPTKAQRLHADVGVDVKQRQRQHDDVRPRLLRRFRPLLQLHARSHVIAVESDDSFGVPVVPPLDSTTARSSGPTGTGGLRAPRCFLSKS